MKAGEFGTTVLAGVQHICFAGTCGVRVGFASTCITSLATTGVSIYMITRSASFQSG